MDGRDDGLARVDGERNAVDGEHGVSFIKGARDFGAVAPPSMRPSRRTILREGLARDPFVPERSFRARWIRALASPLASITWLASSLYDRVTEPSRRV